MSQRPGGGTDSGGGHQGSSSRDRPQQVGYGSQRQGWQGQGPQPQQQGQRGQQYPRRQPAGGNYPQQQQQYPQQSHTGHNFNPGRGGPGPGPQQGMHYAAAVTGQPSTAGYNPHAAAAAAQGGAWTGHFPAPPGYGSSNQEQRSWEDRVPGQDWYNGGGRCEDRNRGYGTPSRQHATRYDSGRGPGRGPGLPRDNRGDRSSPYSGPPGRGRPGAEMLEHAEAAKQMTQLLSWDGPKDGRAFKKDVPTLPTSLPARRPGHGILGSPLNLVVNMFKLELAGERLLHYDVSFERERPQHPRTDASADDGSSKGIASPKAAGAAGAAASANTVAVAESAAGAAARNPKPPDNAREILLLCEEQHWRRPPAYYAFDGAKNLVTPGMRPYLSESIGVAKQYRVTGVAVPGRDKPTTWKVTFRLTKDPLLLAALKILPRILPDKIKDADGEGLYDLLQVFYERRQSLEWFLKEMIMRRTGGRGSVQAALGIVNEVGRTLYFVQDPAPRNIGGGLCALAGLQSGVKLTEGGLMYAADITSSAFLRTDINLVQWMADVAGFHSRDDGAGRGGGRGGPNGGWGRGRQPLAQVGEPDVTTLLRVWSDQLRNKLSAKLKNKKVVYTDPKRGKQYELHADCLSAVPADRAFFDLEPRNEGDNVQEMSVAQYFEEELGHKLQYPQLPVVEMKLPRKCKMAQIWVPPEHLRFDKNKRVHNVTHKGGTEQMIESARKQPCQLKAAICVAVKTENTDDSSALESAFGLKLPLEMQEVQGRVLPGPCLTYQSAGGPGLGRLIGLKIRDGVWNMTSNRLKFSDPATLRSWGLLAVLSRREFDSGAMGCWVNDLITRMVDLGMDLGDTRRLRDELMQNAVWIDERDASIPKLQESLQEAKRRADNTFGGACELVFCFIRDNPSPVYRYIKFAAEVVMSEDMQLAEVEPLGLMTQVVVANRTDVRNPQNTEHAKRRRSEYQTNLCKKMNAKLGGINTKLVVDMANLLKIYFGPQDAHCVPTVMVFGIDLTHPGKVKNRRSIAAVVGTWDRELCRYNHQVWEEVLAGSEAVSKDKLTAAVQKLLLQHLQRTCAKPGCLVVYRDGVSDAELETVRRLEVEAILDACRQMQPDEQYRPRVVYVVVQKRHNVRLFSKDLRNGNVNNVLAGTVVDSTIVSPWLFDFYLNSHAAQNGTSRAARYICLLDELGFDADGLQTFTYWLCYLYCRCARSVSIVAPVHHAHRLASRARMLADDSDDGFSMCSGSSGGNNHMPVFRQFARQLDGKMFFV